MLPLSAIASANDVALQLAGTRRRVMGGLNGDVVLAFSFWRGLGSGRVPVCILLAEVARVRVCRCGWGVRQPGDAYLKRGTKTTNFVPQIYC